MDDPGGGRRGTRAAASSELREVAARWAIPRQHGRDLGGSLNLNLLVRRGDDQLVVRVHRPSVSPARLQGIQQIRDRLDNAGVPCSALVPARDGARWAGGRQARADGRLVEVEQFIPHDGTMNTPQRLASGLSTLGRIHALLAEAAVSPADRAAEFANHVDPDRVLSGTRAGTQRIRHWHPIPQELVAAGEADLVAALPPAAGPRRLLG
jgi:Ser/Thr protein kinase RdoA (MazF antagonist)